MAIGNRIVTNGTIETFTVTDRGLSQTPIPVPALSALAPGDLAAILTVAGGLTAPSRM